MTPTTSLYRLLSLADAEQLNFPSLVDALGAAEKDIVSCEAYSHPYGFSVFNLLSFGDGGLLRLHIWSRLEASQTAEEYVVHDHIYGLTSVIVCGVLAQTQFARGNDREPTHAVYRGTYGQNSSTITRTDEFVGLVELGTERFVPGNRYSLSAGKLHLVEVAQRPTATLVVTRRSASLANPLIFGPRSGVDRITFVRKRLETEMKQKIVAEMISSSRPA